MLQDQESCVYSQYKPIAKEQLMFASPSQICVMPKHQVVYATRGVKRPTGSDCTPQTIFLFSVISLYIEFWQINMLKNQLADPESHLASTIVNVVMYTSVFR
mmetsp:Transcript_22706/g.26070  ORF Transcript_22706/g.26070 Transcript_22706/m.26070 type:complete len:102 (-) Transcript_22706:282-587(-)